MSLIIHNLSKTYPNGTKALDNLSLEINQGMFGLLGPNGAGKSSLMRTLATLQNPDEGSVFFDDIDVLKKPMELRKVLGYLPQDFGVYPKMSATGLIVYLAMGISKFTGENYLDKTKPKNTFDKLFFLTVTQAILVYSIAIPFFILDYTSLPLSIGILTGLMWVPLSWIIDHWIGLFHTLLRTISILILWYVFPNERFICIPIAIVIVYIISIIILLKRKKPDLNNTEANS